jgi:hypothetical protein
MRKALFAPLLALVFAASGSAGTTATLKGVVIARMPAQGELVLASAGGRTTTLRAPSLPATGTILRASAFRLSDGTSAAKSLRALGHVHRAAFRGVLVRTVGSTSFFAAGHNVVVVHTAARSVASARSLADASPLAPGDAADVEVTITAAGQLDEDSMTPTPSGNASNVTLQVTIAAVTPATATTAGSITLTINGQTLVLPLPAGTVLPSAFVANATVGFTVEFKQPGEDNGQGDDDQGDDDNNQGSTTTTTTTATMPTTPSGTAPTTSTATTTTTTTLPSFGHHHEDGHDGGGSGGDGGGGGGGDD